MATHVIIRPGESFGVEPGVPESWLLELSNSFSKICFFEYRTLPSSIRLFVQPHKLMRLPY